MRLRRLAPMLVLMLLIISVLPALASGSAAPISPRVLFNGAELQLPADQKALIVGGSTLVPVRAIFEALGATVEWEDATQTVIGTKGERSIKLPIGAPEATVDGQAIALSQPAQLIGGRTYIPLRFVSEALGARVGWDGETNTVRITDAQPEVGGQLELSFRYHPEHLAPLGSAYIFTEHTPMLRAIYGDGLLRFTGPNLLPELGLARAMPTISDDGLTYTFDLRRDVTFHDGTEVTAADFAFTYSLILAPGHVGPHSQLAAYIQSVTAKDRYRLEFRLKQAYPPFLFVGTNLPPLPSHLLQGVSASALGEHPFFKNPVGAGPFRFREWRSFQHIILERNPAHWEAKVNPQVGPWFETVRYRLVVEPTTSYAALAAGDLDHVPSVDRKLVEWYRSSGEPLQFAEWDRAGHGLFTLNHDRFPTNIREVRQALSLAFDRDQLIQDIFNDGTAVAAGPIPHFHWAANPNLQVKTDREAAIALLEGAGFSRNARGYFERDGHELIIHVVVTWGSPVTEGVAARAKLDFEAIGVRVNVEELDFYTLLDRRITPGEFNLSFSGYSFPADPSSYLGNLFHSSQVTLTRSGENTGQNRGRYRNPAFDALLDRALRTHDLQVRAALYREAEQILVDDAAAIWIYINRYADGLSPRIKGARPVPGVGLQNFEEWYLRAE